MQPWLHSEVKVSLDTVLEIKRKIYKKIIFARQDHKNENILGFNFLHKINAKPGFSKNKGG